ncbi:anaerobic ribonucleoside-triphosphate reductase activating protein [Glaesserella parasuis]|uniref:anaerobic ribonucleoside-triphosphate reductase activating protein n=1 Tax=Glaesserella parasuis TaxID=738 RepID=UPI00136617CA|nr:anaerobic ribonucleoside-triphosphate reductase activating protein [Glaesserella parasuis]MDG6790581.1 anaerobic ribonucleoside-triphosphate reductase activating protein [Glaesserella parasuis]MDO9746874.1 anaerobic ribonucleoside-triphosphate reductase activating protein [Glaesserella parasuis]MDO9771129.1 anaerobic ribonucleoside-triphosphate reductase activating protein [Glaesserella parasuis]MDO9773247.1 anaerobic ribonucleoside-triphosphate reductase activating protein [Glaesserella par
MEQIRFISEQIVWQEVPNETSLAFLISGCPLGCKGCHSIESWKLGSGQFLSEIYLQQRLAQYQGLISCVLFMGGEWLPELLLQRLQLVRQSGLKTCLYTGLEIEQLPQEILAVLDYVKTGRWIAELGGLNCITTNQRFIDLQTGKVLNAHFRQDKQ